MWVEDKTLAGFFLWKYILFWRWTKVKPWCRALVFEKFAEFSSHFTGHFGKHAMIIIRNWRIFFWNIFFTSIFEGTTLVNYVAKFVVLETEKWVKKEDQKTPMSWGWTLKIQTVARMGFFSRTKWHLKRAKAPNSISISAIKIEIWSRGQDDELWILMCFRMIFDTFSFLKIGALLEIFAWDSFQNGGQSTGKTKQRCKKSVWANSFLFRC